MATEHTFMHRFIDGSISKKMISIAIGYGWVEGCMTMCVTKKSNPKKYPNKYLIQELSEWNHYSRILAEEIAHPK